MSKNNDDSYEQVPTFTAIIAATFYFFVYLIIYGPI